MRAFEVTSLCTYRENGLHRNGAFLLTRVSYSESQTLQGAREVGLSTAGLRTWCHIIMKL